MKRNNIAMQFFLVTTDKILFKEIHQNNTIVNNWN